MPAKVRSGDAFPRFCLGWRVRVQLIGYCSCAGWVVQSVFLAVIVSKTDYSSYLVIFLGLILDLFIFPAWFN